MGTRRGTPWESMDQVVLVVATGIKCSKPVSRGEAHIPQCQEMKGTRLGGEGSQREYRSGVTRGSHLGMDGF